MRYLVLLRHGMGVYTVALKLSRSPQGHVSCVETLPGLRPDQPAPGMTWWSDGRYRLTTETGTRLRDKRIPLLRLTQRELAYRVPGSQLLNHALPKYTPEMRGATMKSVVLVAVPPGVVTLMRDVCSIHEFITLSAIVYVTE